MMHYAEVLHGQLQDVQSTGELQAIDIALAHQKLGYLRTVLQEFQTRHMPAMHMSAAMVSNLGDKVEQISAPGGLMLANELAGRYGLEDTERICISIGLPMLEVKQRWAREAAEKADLDLPKEQSENLAAKWLMWHELGHTIAHAYGEVEDNLMQRCLAAKIGQRVFGEPTTELQDIINYTAHFEAFPEGFSQVLVAQSIENDYGYPPEKVSAFLAHLTPQVRVNRARYLSYYYKHLTAEKPLLTKEIVAKAMDDSQYIGYGRPFKPEEVTQALDMLK
jgi:hypothetical protein